LVFLLVGIILYVSHPSSKFARNSWPEAYRSHWRAADGGPLHTTPQDDAYAYYFSKGSGSGGGVSTNKRQRIQQQQYQ
jgi:hypothetical protein